MLVAASLATLLCAGCRRAPHPTDGARPADPALRASSPRIAGTARPGVAATRHPAMRPLGRGELGPAATPSPEPRTQGHPPRRGAQPTRRSPMTRPTGDAPKVYAKRRLRLGKPVPLSDVRVGAEPRVVLRYRLQTGATYTWSVRSDQRTLLRSQKRCPGPGAKPSGKPPRRTLLAGYRLEMSTKAEQAAPPVLILSTRLRKVRLVLPPSLEDRRALLTTLVSDAGYRLRMTPLGRVRLFELNALAPKELADLLQEMKVPLGARQPIYPEAPVGVGGAWRHRQVLPFRPIAGGYRAEYDTHYRVMKVDLASKRPTVRLRVRTAIRVQGKLMAKPFSGAGETTAQVVLDARSGLLLSGRGETRMCTAVLGQTSTNRTTFEQKLLSTTPAAPGTAGTAPPPRRPAPGAQPRRGAGAAPGVQPRRGAGAAHPRSTPR